MILRAPQRLLITLLRLLVITTGLLHLSCAQVPVKNEILYGNEGKLGAARFSIFQPGVTHLSLSQWNAILATQPLVCMSANAFGDVKIEIEQLCSVCNCCSYDMTTTMNSLMVKVQSVRVGK